MKIGENTEPKGFKKIISSFWVWGIIFLISYILFVLAPIQYDESGYSWNAWRGINLYKTIIGYIYAITLLITIILFVVFIIKRIQKSSIGDYWKVAWTIIGIVLIIAYTIFYIKSYIPNEFNKDKYVKESLEEKGYEVISNYYLELGLNENWASVEMKSLGDKNEQAWDGLMALSLAYKNATRYIITILTPENECYYNIDGELYQSFIERGKVGLTNESTHLYKQIKSQIEEETKRCS